jgi:hypothetical protein
MGDVAKMGGYRRTYGGITIQKRIREALRLTISI